MSYSESDVAKWLQDNPDLSIEGNLNYSRNSNSSDCQPQAHLPKLSEHEMQVKLIRRCDAEGVGPIFAIPNGGQRNPLVAAKLKAEGVRAGVPDLFLAVMSRGYGGLFLELKIRPNKPTAEQREWIGILEDNGYAVVVVYDSVDEAMMWIHYYLTGEFKL